MAGTVLQEIAERAQGVLARAGHTFADFAEAFAGMDRERAARLVNETLGEVLNAPAGDRRYTDELRLFGSGDFTLTLRVVGGEDVPGVLCASEFDLLVVNLGPDAVDVPLYRAAVDPADTQRRPDALRSAGTARLEPYVPRVFSAYADVAVLGAASAEAPVLVVHSRARGTVTWVFDRATGRPLNLTANHLTSSRVQVAARVLGAIGTPEHAPRLEELAASDYLHFVRWEAAEAVYRLDPARAERLLEERLAHDPHPAVRGSARRTLENIHALAQG